MATTSEDLTTAPIQNTPMPYVTFEDYLAWNGEGKVEWKDGEMLFMAAASIKHEMIFGFLLTLLRLYVGKNNLGMILGSDVVMKLEAQRRGREPDIMFVAKERIGLLKKNYLDGAADVAVEIVSPESIGRDRGEKFVEYEAAGVKEYWLIDPERQQAEFYRLGADNHYRLAQIEDGVFRSEIIEGFWLRVGWLWNLPDDIEAMRELKII